MTKPQGAFAPSPRKVNAVPKPSREAPAEDGEPVAAWVATRAEAVPLPNTVSQHGSVPRQEASPSVALEPQEDIARVPEGDLQGFSVEEYVQGVFNGISEAMGEADLRTAGAALDMALEEFLAVTMHAEGPRAAQQFGARFAETVLPFAQLQLNGMTYGELLKLKRPK